MKLLQEEQGQDQRGKVGVEFIPTAQTQELLIQRFLREDIQVS
jgi:hypothetical protein